MDRMRERGREWWPFGTFLLFRVPGPDRNLSLRGVWGGAGARVNRADSRRLIREVKTGDHLSRRWISPAGLLDVLLLLLLVAVLIAVLLVLVALGNSRSGTMVESIVSSCLTNSSPSKCKLSIDHSSLSRHPQHLQREQHFWSLCSSICAWVESRFSSSQTNSSSFACEVKWPYICVSVGTCPLGYHTTGLVARISCCISLDEQMARVGLG